MNQRGKTDTLYIQVKEFLESQIKCGNICPGDKVGTENELAAKFGVSRPTIRQVLIALENEGYLERIHGRGTFISEKTGRVESLTCGKNIYMIVPHLTSSFVGRIVAGAQEVLFKEGYNLSLFSTNDQMETEKEYIRDLMEKEADGLIVHPTKAMYYNPMMFELYQRNIPLVMTGRHYRYLDTSFVEADNYRGSYEATSYLIGLGHRNIGLVSKAPAFETSLENRIQGYQDALADHGLPLNRKMFFTDLKDNRNVYYQEQNEIHEKNVIEQLQGYLKKNSKLTAVLALNDMIAADIIKAAKMCGRTVGVDLSVVGFDNVNLSASLDPPLTTVDFPTMEIGRLAAGIMIEHLRDPGLPPKKQYVPCKLIIRESCAHA